MAFQLFLYWASKSLSWDPERKAERCESYVAIELQKFAESSHMHSASVQSSLFSRHTI